MITSPSSLRSRAAAAALAGLLIFPLAPAVAEPAADSAALAPAAQQSSQGQSLTWGFRQSFISYVGGHHRIDDGVTESGREYTFPLTEVQQDGDRVELSGHGLLQFAQYCKDTADTNTCQLDLTFTAPRVVLDPAGESAIYYTVRTRNYQSGQIEGPHEVKMATLDLTSATQDAEYGVVTWSNIPATLTEDGAHAFSNFYDPGTALAPLNLTYRGKAIDVAPASYTVAESWDSKTETRDLHRVLELKGRVLHLTKSSWGDGDARATVLDARTMEPLHTAELPVTASMAVAADPAAGRLYYADRQTHALASAVVTEDGSLRLEGTVPGGEIGEDAFALGYDPTHGTLAALSLDGQGSGSIRFLDSEGSVTEHALPDPVSVSPKLRSLPRPESLQTAEFYGSTYLNNARLLAPLPDGSFVYSPGSTVYDDEDIRVLTGQLLHFSPQGEPVRDVSDQIFPAASIGVDLRGLETSGDTVLRWNPNWGGAAADQVLRYRDGAFAIVKHAGAPADGASEISGEFMDDDGLRAVVDTNRGRVVWLDPKGAVVEEIGVPNLQKTAKNHPTALKLSTGDVIVPTMLEDEVYDEILHLQRLARTESAPEPGPAPTPEPTGEPTADPSPAPTGEPTAEPTAEPTPEPTGEPSPAPTTEPSPSPTEQPTAAPSPTGEPTTEPTAEPSPAPTEEPTAGPEPTAEPTDGDAIPTASPSAEPVPGEAEDDPTAPSASASPSTDAMEAGPGGSDDGPGASDDGLGGAGGPVAHGTDGAPSGSGVAGTGTGGEAESPDSGAGSGAPSQHGVEDQTAGGLARTGAAVTAVAIVAVALLAAGVGVLSIRRRTIRS